VVPPSLSGRTEAEADAVAFPAAIDCVAHQTLVATSLDRRGFGWWLKEMRVNLAARVAGLLLVEGALPAAAAARGGWWARTSGHSPAVTGTLERAQQPAATAGCRPG
jgi:hypothetical protein